MLIVIAIVVCAWFLGNGSKTERIIVTLSVGLVISYIVAVLASMPPITEIPLNDDEALRFFPQIAYPFCIQQYRDYAADLFSYSIIFGWPEGMPLVQFALQEDQSHFIHYQHYLAGFSLGLILLLGMVVLVGILSLIENKMVFARRLGNTSTLLLATLQVILIVQISSIYLSGNIIYPIGGIIVVLITLYPTYRAIRERNNGGPEAI